MISIIIPLFEKAAQVRETLDSVRWQVFTAYEVIIVDDGSTDGSPDIVRDYLWEHRDFAARVRLFHQLHAGVSAARNKGIRESRFAWIAFLDADDSWTPEYLQAQYELSLKYPLCEVLAAGYGIRSSTSQFAPARLFKLPFRSTDGILRNYFEVAACSHPPLCSSIIIVRKKAIQAVGGFPEGVTSGEDLLTWARLAIHYTIAYNKKCMGVHNRDPSRFNHDQRTRMPARNDMVGGCLERLLIQHAGIRGLKEYVGSWHKMRARIYLSNSMKKEAWGEWRKLVRFNPVNYKTWAYLLLLISPVKAFH